MPIGKIMEAGVFMANIIEIKDINAKELDVYAHLTHAQLMRHDGGLFVCESAKAIEHALESGVLPISLLMEEKQLKSNAKIIEKCGDIPLYTAKNDVLEQLTGYRLTRGILCAMRRPKAKSVSEVCKGAKRIAVLEGIVDPTNVGAIIRSAAALNMDGVLISPTCCDVLHRRAVRVSMGTVFQIPWARIGNKASDWPENGIKELHELGFKTAAMALDGNCVSIDDEILLGEEKLAVILGTEGDGLAGSTIAACDYTVKIPMGHGVDSLNVAAASAVAFWQLAKR